MGKKLHQRDRSSLVYLTLGIIGMLCSACPDLGERYAAEELWLSMPSSWESVEPIFKVRCRACHGETPAAGATFSLSTYEQTYHWAERIRQQVILYRTMPPGGLQDEQELERIAHWIAQGAPGPSAIMAGVEAGEDAGESGLMGGMNSGQEAGNSAMNLSWSDVASLFDIYCNTCHANPPTGGAPFPLISYQAVQPYLARIRIRSIERQDMPPGGIQDPNDLARLEQWLNEGGIE